jgi:YggT family protein
MPELLSFIALLIQLYIYVVFAAAILSWLVAFNMLNTRNRFIYMVGSALNRLTEPAVSRIRRYVPELGGFDFSPLILILALFFLRDVVVLGWLARAAGAR